MPKKENTIRRMTRAEFFKLATYVRENHEKEDWPTASVAAEAATKALGFYVPPAALREAMDAAGVHMKIRRTVTATNGFQRTDRVHIVATELIKLIEELGMEVPASLIAVKHRKRPESE